MKVVRSNPTDEDRDRPQFSVSVTAREGPSQIWLRVGQLTCYFVSLLQTNIGYLVPTYNNELQVPLVLLLNDDAIYPHDPFAATLPYYASPLWRVVAVLTRVVPIPELFITLVLLDRFFILWAAGRLAQAFVPNNRVAVLGSWAMLALAPQPLIGAGTIVAGEFEQTSVAIGFLLLATAALIEGRPLAWATAMGLAANANILYTLYAVTYHFAFLAFDRKARSPGYRWVIGWALAFLLGLPAVILSVQAVRFIAPDAGTWVRALHGFYPDHFFPDAWRMSAVRRHAALSVMTIGVAYVYRRAEPSHWRLAVTSTVVGTGWLALAVVSATLATIPTLLVLHPARASDIWYCYAGLLLISLLAAKVDPAITPASLTRGTAAGVAFLLAVFWAGGLLVRVRPAIEALAIFLLLVVCSRSLAHLVPRIGPTVFLGWRRTAGLAVVLTLSLTTYLDRGEDLARLGLRSIFGGPDPQQNEIAEWARHHARRDAVFLIPPDWGGFRALSGRSVFVTYKDGAAILWRQDFVEEWITRCRALGVDPTTVRDDLLGRLYQAYPMLDEERATELMARHRIDYWVTRLETKTTARVVHAGERFKVVAVDRERRAR